MSGCWRTLQNLKKCSAEFCETSWLFPGVPGWKHLTKCISKPGVHCYSSFWGHWPLFRFIQGIPVSECTSTGYLPHWKKGASLGTKNIGPPENSPGKILEGHTWGKPQPVLYLLGYGEVQAEIQGFRKGCLGPCVLVAFLLPAESEHDRAVCYRAQESKAGAWQHSLCNLRVPKLFLFLHIFFLLTLTQIWELISLMSPFLPLWSMVKWTYLLLVQ